MFSPFIKVARYSSKSIFLHHRSHFGSRSITAQGVLPLAASAFDAVFARFVCVHLLGVNRQHRRSHTPTERRSRPFALVRRLLREDGMAVHGEAWKTFGDGVRTSSFVICWFSGGSNGKKQPEWFCSQCNASNFASRGVCRGCKAPRSSVKPAAANKSPSKSTVSPAPRTKAPALAPWV